jgi:heme/copper-type cytochrome/quinol oxidase subunit 2
MTLDGATRPRRVSTLIVFVSVSWAVALAAALPGASMAPQGARREFSISARKYIFAPAVIEVAQHDLVKITLLAEDIPHSFTIDEYRIAKRAGAGQTVTFEFHADRAGTFPFYCNLTIDDGCRAMQGRLVVK